MDKHFIRKLYYKWIDTCYVFGLAAPRLIWRRLTAHRRLLPNVFLLGATKCGTTTLADALWQHPMHLDPMHKELMYLQGLPNFQSNYQWHPVLARLWGYHRYSQIEYRKFFPTTSQARVHAARNGAFFTSDCDPFNFYCPVALDRIRTLPHRPKLIIVLRNPIDRAYSDFNMYRARVDPTLNFERCIAEEICGNEKRFRWRFLNQSIYAPHVERWLATFPRDDILFLKSEDLYRNAQEIARQMFLFLQLPIPPKLELKRLNTGNYESEMVCQTRSMLAQYFDKHNRRLYQLLGRDMAW